ncbi:hypothetical protein ScPMuIL_016409 [Solemya velum]
MATDKNTTFGLPDLSGLSESERLQVLAVMQRAQEFEKEEDAKMMVPLEGQLYKYTNVMKGWQYRWFLLDPYSGMLDYFEKEEHKKQKPRGSVYLAAAVVSPSEEDSQTFSIHKGSSEIYRLRAIDAKERQHWVDRLRATSESHTVNMLQSTTNSLESKSPTRKKVSTENLHNSVIATPKLMHKAPAPRPHTLDPFREVRDYLVDADEHAMQLNEKINALPQAGQPICALDKDLLLLKATSAAAFNCLSQCLSVLQQRQVSNHELYQLRYSCICSANYYSRGCCQETFNLQLIFSIPSVVSVDHDEEVEDEKEYKDTELGEMDEHKSIILHLLSQLRLGMDLTKVVLPTFILEKRSLLELFADCMAHPDIFLKIPTLPDAESRMLAVVEWYLTSFHVGRQSTVAKKPYNPIIGETFHCSWKVPYQTETVSDDGTSTTNTENVQLIYCAEQVSHHPPVSAFYFECPAKQMSVNASMWTKSKFMGLSIGVQFVGKIVLKLLEHGEEYVFGLPSAYARSILTVPWVELGDKITISCQQTNYSAAVTFHTKPFYGGKLNRISAEVKNCTTGEFVSHVHGEWNSVMEFTYANGESKSVNINDLNIHRKRVRPCNKQGEFESRRLWQHVTNALKVGDVNTATAHKKLLEDRQREGEKHRKETQTPFPTKYFHQEGDVWTYNKVLQKGSNSGAA